MWTHLRSEICIGVFLCAIVFYSCTSPLHPHALRPHPLVPSHPHTLTPSHSCTQTFNSEVNSGFFYKSATDREKLVAAERKFVDDKVQQVIDLKKKVHCLCCMLRSERDKPVCINNLIPMPFITPFQFLWPHSQALLFVVFLPFLYCGFWTSWNSSNQTVVRRQPITVLWF